MMSVEKQWGSVLGVFVVAALALVLPVMVRAEGPPNLPLWSILPSQLDRQI